MQPNTLLQKLLHLIQQNDAPEAVLLIASAAIQYKYSNLFFNVPEHIEQPTAYLLLIVIDADAKQCTQRQSHIENVLQAVAEVTCWYMSLNSFNEQLLQGSYFACTVYTKAERLFIETDAGFVLPAATPLCNQYQSQWHQRALEFYAGAELYIIRKQYALAAFNLHQCAEQCFTSIIYNKSGYRPSTHNLLLLYRYACWFEPLLHELFIRQQLKEESLLHVLQGAYTGSRYTNEYSVKGRQLEIMKEKVEVLLERAKVVSNSQLTIDNG
jgi:uncharacterized protein